MDNLISTPTQRIVFYLITYIYLFIINKKLYSENIYCIYIYATEITKILYCIYVCKLKMCVYLFSLLQYTWDRILKK